MEPETNAKKKRLYVILSKQTEVSRSDHLRENRIRNAAFRMLMIRMIWWAEGVTDDYF